MKWYLHAIRNFANFDDRASRTEYWMFNLFNLVFAIICYSVDLIFNLHIGNTSFGPFYSLYFVFSILPGLAIAIRRMHDLDKSGWYLLLAIVPIINIYSIVLFCTKSNEEGNAYGEKPVNTDISTFLNDDKTNTRIIIIALIWLFISRIFWIIVTTFIENFYQTQYFKHYNEIMNCIGMFFPLLLSFSIKNHKWKIILLLCSAIYVMYSFYELVRLHQVSSNFQF
ncbi:DUF805 domain-containing protein [Flavobacterium sp.]|uniref:DUF805 domain-containing protein n=1 Tax=Flavobacterium sp. TaxID=239 RepID=UPI0037502FA3